MKKLLAWVFPLITFITILFMILHPQDTLDAALQGFTLWSRVVLPALFPFLVAAGLLFPLGMVDYLGILLEPIMAPLFRLPGCASLPVFMGFTSGFPVGAILTRRLYDEKRISLSEAEHLLAFTNNSSPLFILGSVGIGLFGNPAVGLLLLLTHYGSNFLVGLSLRFTHPKVQLPTSHQQLLTQANQALHQHRQEQPLSIGKIMGDAIHSAFVSILTIAGFIVIFSVLTRMFSYWGGMEILAQMFLPFTHLLGLSPQVVTGLSQGLFEMTLGCQSIAGTSADLASQLTALVLITAFSGISIIAQIMSIMASVPIRWKRFLLCRGLQMGLSLLLLRILSPLFLEVPVFTNQTWAEQSARLLYSFDAWTLSLLFLLGSLLLLLLILLCIAWHYRS